MKDKPVDVLIIGAGASGAALAWSLSETKMNILCLEQGDWMNVDTYPSTLIDHELHRFGDFSANPNIRKRSEDYPINSEESPLTPLNFNAVGGGTIIYIGHFPRLHPSDFRTKTLDGVGDDWPIDYNTLEPFFAMNDRMMGVSGITGNPAYPPYSVPLPPIPLGKGGHALAKGFNELGWHWWPSDAAIASKPYNGRNPCVNAGPCDLGCATGAKASTDITYWPLAIQRGVQLKTQCRVREITVDNTGMADGVLYYDKESQLQKQKAQIVVLACNGIGTPRILLNSQSKLFPEGLANHNGLVGKNLMLHPDSVVAGIFDKPMEGFKGPMGSCITSHEFYETDPNRDFVRGYTYEGVRNVGPMTAALGGTVVDSPVPWGQEHWATMDGAYEYVAGLSVIAEDLPEEHNRVTLDPILTDDDGIPAPKITYQLSENSNKMLAHAEEKGQEVLRAGGAIFTDVQSTVPAAWHLLGTTRMGTDPERSVVNSWGRSHDVKNLFIVDGSVFVTAGGVNPTSTIQAIALYIGDQIKKNRGNLFE
jgi:choline dehydrogenase-like flavoprotein